tara:strand:- start:925 stop:1422 length:498 start_codon:yes stop_codon:yes gene_type:complete
MPEYRVKSSGAVKTKSQLELENKNTSFPKVWNTSVLEMLGVDPVFALPQPSPSASYKRVIRNGVSQDSKGDWYYAWTEQDMFTEYTDSDGKTVTVTEQKTAYDTANTATLAASERTKRDSLLKETDHYALSDVTMSDDMKTYRQALRDVPQQTDFPTTITWPTKP